MSEINPPQTEAPQRMALLRAWLSRRLPPDGFAWLEQQTALIASGEGALQHLGIAIGLAPRKIGKSDLDLDAAEQNSGRALRRDLDTTGWSVDQAARVLLVLASFRGDDAAFAQGLDRVFASADIGEQIALLRGFSLFPAAALHLPHALEGVRSAMQPVFEAIAHRNPYPRELFSEAQWNQMVLKALFIGSRLAPIQGLDARRNADLARMLIDYADERRAAARPISPELWRCVAPFAGDAEVAKLTDILANGSEVEAAGAALSLAECPLPAARAALTTKPDYAAAIDAGRLTWNHI